MTNSSLSLSLGLEQRRAALRRMMASRRRACIRFCPLAGCFVFKNRADAEAAAGAASYAQATEGETTLRGATPLLRRVCYPDYSYDAAVKAARVPRGARQPTGLRHPREGRRRGSAVHEQLACLVNEGAEALARRYQPQFVHKYVGLIRQALAQLRLVPLVAEFADFDERLRVGTAFDLVCADAAARVVLVELKVGGENHFELGSGWLRAPRALAHYNNCPKNQAFLQLALYRAMFARHYPYAELGAAVLLRVTTAGVHVNVLPDAFAAAQDQLVEALARADRPGPATPRRPRSPLAD